MPGNASSRRMQYIIRLRFEFISTKPNTANTKNALRIIGTE